MAKKPAEKRVALSDIITITQRNHDKLWQHIKDRLDFARLQRDALAPRFERIDRTVVGHKKESKADRQRRLDNDKSGDLKPTDVNLQFAEIQIDDLNTYFMQVFAPDGGMYEAVARKDQQQISKSFSLLMNQHAEFKGYYTQFSKSFQSMLKYNVGGAWLEWEKITGNRIVNDEGGTPKIESAITWEGNAVVAFDMYNTMWDPTVPVYEMPLKGEYFAVVEMLTKFAVKRLMEQKKIAPVEMEWLGKKSAPEQLYYHKKPEVSHPGTLEGDGIVDWDVYMSAGGFKNVGVEFELVTCWMCITPKEFGLSQDDTIQIWKFKILQGQRIVFAEVLNNAHGMLPCAFAMLKLDEMGMKNRSHVETLAPLQLFASFLMNVHQRASRKALWGVTTYNADTVDIENRDDDDNYVTRVAVRPSIGDNDVQKHFRQNFEGPKTEQTTQDIQRMVELMQYFMPSNVQQQVASLERATQYQAAAVKQGTNSRSHKLARLIHSQMMVPLNYQLMQNILQYQASMELVSPEGEVVEVNPAEYRKVPLSFAVSDGLKGIDRLLVIEGMKEILGMILQRPEVNQEVDVLAFMNYISTMMGDRFDLTEFKQKDPFEQAGMGMQEKAMGLQLLQAEIQKQEAAKQGGTPAPMAQGLMQ